MVLSLGNVRTAPSSPKGSFGGTGVLGAQRGPRLPCALCWLGVPVTLLCPQLPRWPVLAFYGPCLTLVIGKERLEIAGQTGWAYSDKELSISRRTVTGLVACHGHKAHCSGRKPGDMLGDIPGPSRPAWRYHPALPVWYQAYHRAVVFRG